MQGMTRALGALEPAKSMASPGAVLLSSSAGGVKSSVVLDDHGGSRHFKRKGLPGDSVYSSTRTIGKNKLWSSTKEMTKETAALVVDAISTAKRRFFEKEIVGDPSEEDAVLALTELQCLRPPAGSSPPIVHESALLQWNGTRARSRRPRLVESSGNEYHVAATTDNSNPSPLPLQKQQQQVSECSSSRCGDSQSVVTLAKVEDGPFCSSTGVEEEEQVEQHQVLDVVVEKEIQYVNNITNSICSPGDSEGLALPKLTSVSSIESLQPDSPVESPSSLLADASRAGESSSGCGLVPKFEGSPSPKVAPVRPVRPVKKSILCRKLKVEEKAFDDLSLEQAPVKLISRKKPRPTGFVPQQQQVQQQLAPVKVEEADAFCALALGPPRLSAEEEEVKKVRVASCIVLPPPAAAVAAEEKRVILDPQIVIKLETKPSGKLGQRTASKAKPAQSEADKELKKLRRVQANRESARLTIRKKQAEKDEKGMQVKVLLAERETLKKELEQILQIQKNLIEANAKVREQIEKSGGIVKPGTSPPPPPPIQQPPDALVQHLFPAHPFGALSYALPIWSFTPPQAQAAAAQAAGVQPSDPQAMSAFFAATAAANGNNGQGGLWNMASSSQGQPSMLSPFYQGYVPAGSVPPALPSSWGTPATRAPTARTVSLPVGPTDASFPLAASERSFPSGNPVARAQSVSTSEMSKLRRYDMSGPMSMTQERPAKASEAQKAAAAAAARRRRIELNRTKTSRQFGRGAEPSL